MGYYYSQREAQDFHIDAEVMPAVHAAATAYIAAHPKDKTYYDQYRDEKTTTDLLLLEASCEWQLEYDDVGNVVSIDKFGEHKDYNEQFLAILAPFVKPDSFIEMEGENDDDIWRFVFHPKFEGGYEKVYAKLVFEY